MGVLGTLSTASLVLTAPHAVIKMGLFTDIPKPSLEMYCKNKLEWEGSIEGAQQAQVM